MKRTSHLGESSEITIRVSWPGTAGRDTNVRALVFAFMLCVFGISCGHSGYKGREFGPMTIREMPNRYLLVDAHYPGGGGTVDLAYTGGSKCGTFSELQASVNGVALHLEESGGKGVFDPDQNEYRCKLPWFSLPHDTRIPQDAAGKHVLVLSDPSAS